MYFALCLLLTVCQASLTCSSPARFHQVFVFANSSTFLLLRDVIFHKFRKHNLLCKALLGETGLALLRQLAQAVGVPTPVAAFCNPTNLKNAFYWVKRRILVSPIGQSPWPTLCSWPEGSRSPGHSPRKTRCHASQSPSKCRHSRNLEGAGHRELDNHRGFPRRCRSLLPGWEPCQVLPRDVSGWSRWSRSP